MSNGSKKAIRGREVVTALPPSGKLQLDSVKHKDSKKKSEDKLTIKKIVKCRCGIELPVSGGIGNTINNPVKILSGFNIIAVENSFITCMVRRIWSKIEQRLIEKDTKKIDMIIVEIPDVNGCQRLQFFFEIDLESSFFCS
jgi:hypothetical protein